MNWEKDPWTNPEFGRRRDPVGRAWRSGKNRALTVLAAAGLAYTAYSLVGGELGFVRLREMRRHQVELAGQIEEKKKTVAALERQIRSIERTQEEQARRLWNMARPNERIYRIVDADSAARVAGGVGPATEPGQDGRSGEGAPGTPGTSDDTGRSDRTTAP